jgi:hypothetical protein
MEAECAVKSGYFVSEARESRHVSPTSVLSRKVQACPVTDLVSVVYRGLNKKMENVRNKRFIDSKKGAKLERTITHRNSKRAQYLTHLPLLP